MASVAAPHRLAEEAGADILARGGTAVEAAVTVAATLCTVYPHMTGLGGDGFWLVAEPGQVPRAFQACGPAARAATSGWYRDRGFSSVPPRGGAAALTVAGAVGGWSLALEATRSWGGRLSVAELLADARRLALQGTTVTRSHGALAQTKADELSIGPLAAREGDLLVQPRLAAVWDELGRGLDRFYRGDLAATLALDLADLGSPLEGTDLAAYRAREVVPLSVDLSVGTVWNLPPPTQGAASLAILAMFDRLGVRAEGFEHVHGLVEATKRAFAWRNARVGDPAFVDAQAPAFLAPEQLDHLAATIGPHATGWPHPEAPGDTVWFGVIDDAGRAVSVIQSLYWEFGAGVLLPRTGLLWQNRGSSFALEGGPNVLAPGRLPFHTLNPALARLNDGRTLVYGTMGGEGQPQTQAAFLTRYAWFGQGLREALATPRWLLGRTWGEDSTKLRLEGRFDPAVVAALAAAGHPTEVVADFDDRMGHAGAVVRHADGMTEAAHDPRADGAGLDLPSSAAPDPAFDLHRLLASLASFGAETDGSTTRRLYDAAWSASRSWLAAEFGRRGLAVRDDRVGNLYGRLEGTEGGPVVLTGSHFDTVTHGGWFDGAYGVAASLVAAQRLAARYGRPRHTLEVVAFCEEEGSRFPLAYWGSGHLAGLWPEDTDQRRDAQGTSLADAMAEAGFGRPDQDHPRRTDLGAFVEVHVEQGIVLENEGLRVGVVDAIVGQRRWLVRVRGQANHAGTTPMALRRDALAGAVEMMAALEREARTRGAPLVATVGFVEVSPNTPNVVPGEVAFSVDARHTDGSALASFHDDLRSQFTRVAADRGLKVNFEPRMAVEPTPLSPALGALVAQACTARGLAHRVMASGAGHDTQVMAALCPSTLIFVPSRAGISHSPQEYSTRQALADGLDVLEDVLYRLAWKGELP